MLGWHHGMWDGASWLLMSALMLAALAALVGAVISGSRFLHAREQPPPAQSARRVLDERFASGEIDEEDYLRRREVLERR